MTEVKSTESAGVVLFNRNGEVLLVEQYGKAWSCPKGHLENREDITSAALRELKEETGIPAQFIRIYMAEDGGDDDLIYSYTRESRYGLPETKTIHLIPAVLVQAMDNLALCSEDDAITDYKWLSHWEIAKFLKPWHIGREDIDLCKEDARAILKTLNLMLENKIPLHLQWAIKANLMGKGIFAK